MIINIEKENTINIVTHINELVSQTEVTQSFKNTRKTPIELEIIIPQLTNCNITRFEMIKNDKKIVSKLLEKEKKKKNIMILYPLEIMGLFLILRNMKLKYVLEIYYQMKKSNSKLFILVI